MAKSKPAAKPKKPTSAEQYNERQAGKLWSYSELPSAFADLRKRPLLFSDAVRSFQKSQGLAQDGKLGPKTLAKIRGAYSPAPPVVDAKPDPEGGDAEESEGD